MLSRNSKAYSSLPRTTVRPTIIFTTEHIRAEFTFKSTPQVVEIQSEADEKVVEEPKVEIKETETPVETPKVRKTKFNLLLDNFSLAILYFPGILNCYNFLPIDVFISICFNLITELCCCLGGKLSRSEPQVGSQDCRL